MDTTKNQITPTVKEQTLKVRDTGETNYSISQVRFFSNNWVAGKIGGLNFQAKVYTEVSEFGIKGGNVSKLTVYPEYGPIAISYDRDWDIKPKNAKEEKIVDTILDTILDYCSHIYDGIKDSLQPSIDLREKQ